MENGIEYEGEFKNNLRHGKGKMVWKNGNVYEGSWKDGMADGYGSLMLRDGYTHYGYFKDNWYIGNIEQPKVLVHRSFHSNLPYSKRSSTLGENGSTFSRTKFRAIKYQTLEELDDKLAEQLKCIRQSNSEKENLVTHSIISKRPMLNDLMKAMQDGARKMSSPCILNQPDTLVSENYSD